MEKEKLIASWKAEEEIAYIHGWDFSHIEGRYSEDTDFPWDYKETVLKYLTPDKKILDIDTGGGEILLSLKHPYNNTAASEGYPPNVELCKNELLPLGIDFRPGNAEEILPFEDESFDVIINRHGSFNPEDIYRMLKPGGLFITQQVGAENERELVNLLCGDTSMSFPQQYLDITVKKFEDEGFTVIEKGEIFKPIRFYDIGALVWFARIIQWEFPEFSVDTHIDKLFQAQRILEKNGCIEGRTHRFMLVAKK
ncbi:MAG: class I SAM-dependent methyltransferase [Oscillospiraceae bacterium]|nr:class I SAM-dependent methyltransferase [Oscillospiraceae bacterium]